MLPAKKSPRRVGGAPFTAVPLHRRMGGSARTVTWGTWVWLVFAVLVKTVVGSGGSAGSSTGVAEADAWAFAGPSGGGSLSDEMVASRGGYSLVRVGTGHGVLVAPDGRLTAVASGQNLRASTAHLEDPPTPALRDAIVAARNAREAQRAPCPSNADAIMCSAWCRGISAPLGEVLRGVHSGGPCVSGPEDFSTNCTCHSTHTFAPVAWCRSPCTSRVGAQKPAVSAENSTSSRYLLYDARFGTSFAAQIETLFVAMRFVSNLNEAGGAPPWTLVLPPWCAVVHWYSDTSHMFWHELFDVKALAKEAPMIEFNEYTRRKGGEAAVDVAVVPSFLPKTASSGDFGGWQRKLDACAVDGQVVPQHSHRNSRVVVDYSGYCDGDVVSSGGLRCGWFRRLTRRAVKDMFAALPTKAGSVLLKHLDALPFPVSGAKVQQLHFALRPTATLELIADTFISDAFGGLPYLAVHLRRNEHVLDHPASVPSVEAAVARLNFLVKEKALDQVFVATDARRGFRESLRRGVKAPLYYFSKDDGAAVPSHKGKEAVTVLRVLARARHFIGSSKSAFTKWARRERRRLGQPEDSSTEVFCDSLTLSVVDRSCTAPAD